VTPLKAIHSSIGRTQFIGPPPRARVRSASTSVWPQGPASSEVVAKHTPMTIVTALQKQLQRLPPKHAAAFVMRECWGHDKAEICKDLAISISHLWVMLHRTRQRLRHSLADHCA
jgi:DNA-directed RNA polymerase specialized sigma24 family protein